MQPWSIVRSGVVAAVGVLGLGPVAGTAAAGASWPVDGGDVRILVPVKPGGAFEAKTPSLSGALTPGSSKPLALTGELAVDLATIDTGIPLRDQHLRERLHLDRGPGFERAVLSEIVLNDADGVAFRGETGFSGTLLLHGVSRTVTGRGQIRAEGSGVRVVAEFVLTLTDFEIEPPSYMGVGVTNKLVVTVSFAASPSPGSGR